jgi:uncharacterized membrane protein
MGATNQIAVSTEPTIKNQWGHSLWFRLLLLVALGMGLFFRLAGLGNKIYSHDEAYASLRAAGYGKGDVLASIQDGRDHPVEDIQKFLKPGSDKTGMDTVFITASSGPHQAPLFYVLAHYWMRVVGFTAAAMRGLAALLGILSIAAMYWLSRELFQSQRIALLSAALFAVSPFHILFSQDARPYSLWTLAALLSSAALLQAVREKTWGHWLLYSLTLVLGLYSQQLFLLVVLVHVLYVAGMYLLQNKIPYRRFLSAGILSFFAYVPWLYMVIKYWDSAVESMDWATQGSFLTRYLRSWLVTFSSSFIDMDFASGNLVPHILRALVLALIAYGLVSVLLHGSKQEKIFLTLLTIIPAGALILPDMLLGGIRSVGGRYFVPLNIATVLIVAYVLSNRLDRARPQPYVWPVLVGLLLTVSLISNVNSLQAESWWNKELGWIRPEFVYEIDKDGALLIVSSEAHGSMIGDLLSLGLMVDSDVHFRLATEPEQIQFSDEYASIYWFPGSNGEVLQHSEEAELQVRKVLDQTLWQIEGKTE